MIQATVTFIWTNLQISLNQMIPPRQLPSFVKALVVCFEDT